eukprot:gnl/Spiro4/7255_TR3793_c0_g1_i1.p1 gnl/Spiro4/7255_TR3793_c0_g1~~gnl/Spiro4/7255_TR3793_c0_g1_i1.p1  ORF type:complete len:331 (+),score=98.56 gnl/Spiro4/7255_TR3793_c0_g1_i1:77-994(+)
MQRLPVHTCRSPQAQQQRPSPAHQNNIHGSPHGRSPAQPALSNLKPTPSAVPRSLFANDDGVARVVAAADGGARAQRPSAAASVEALAKEADVTHARRLAELQARHTRACEWLEDLTHARQRWLQTEFNQSLRLAIEKHVNESMACVRTKWGASLSPDQIDLLRERLLYDIDPAPPPARVGERALHTVAARAAARIMLPGRVRPDLPPVQAGCQARSTADVSGFASHDANNAARTLGLASCQERGARLSNVVASCPRVRERARAHSGVSFETLMDRTTTDFLERRFQLIGEFLDWEAGTRPRLCS